MKGIGYKVVNSELEYVKMRMKMNLPVYSNILLFAGKEDAY